MDSSEDDAGTASASRCASAREKDVGLAEDVDAARNFQHESSETRVSCRTPAMSEDNFDGDSVPSPSSKETSTEAILDMIDDFIGDPRAARLTPPVVVERVPTPPAPSTSSDSQKNKLFEEPSEQITVPPREPSPAPVADIETVSESDNVQPAEAECTPHSEILICVNTSPSEESPKPGSSVQVECSERCSTQPLEISQNVAPEVSTEGFVMTQSESVETVTSDTSECDSLGRTVKCATSSENRDSVTVELAESTSSECNISESKVLSMEPTMSRSPLKRRLIRPAPSDRRPDSTVSSTVDSHIDIHTIENTSDTIAKDVSSSSDAVPLHGIIKPEEISNVSEISICKAETSAPKKIKLVRPKVPPVMSNSPKSETQAISVTIERDQCQSTSSDDISMPSSAVVDTSSSVITNKSEKQENTSAAEFSVLKQQSAEISEPLQDVLTNSAVASYDKTEKEPECTETPPAVEISVPNTAALSEIHSIVNTSSANNHMREMEKQTSSNVTKEVEKVSPIKSRVPNLAATETAEDVTEAQCSSTNLEQPQESQEESLLSTLVGQDISQIPSSNCDQDNRIISDIAESTISESEKKVPPMKINLVTIDNCENKESSTVQKSQIVEDQQQESTNCMVEDPVKQVPKLTIKLTNKHDEEGQSSVPKLKIKPLQPPVEHSDVHNIQQAPSETKANMSSVPQPTEKVVACDIKPIQPSAEKNSDSSEKSEEPITKSYIKPLQKSTEKVNQRVSTTMQSCRQESGNSKQIPSVSKINIKPIPKPVEKGNEIVSTALKSDSGEDIDVSDSSKQIPNVLKINIKPIIVQPVIKVNESVSIPTQSVSGQDSDKSKQIPHISKIHIKPILKPFEEATKSMVQSSQKTPEENVVDSGTNKQIVNIVKLNIKPIVKPTEMFSESLTKPLPPAEQDNGDSNKIPNVSKINIKPIVKPVEKVSETSLKPPQPTAEQNSDESTCSKQISNVSKLNIKPIPKPSEKLKEGVLKVSQLSVGQDIDDQQFPSLTKINIKPIPKPTKKGNESVPRSLRSADQKHESHDTKQQTTSIKKLNIKSIPKPSKNLNDSILKPQTESVHNDIPSKNEQFPVITKLNIKPIIKPPEKIYEVHRKSSSSEISESECSENDESTSTSDQASTSDQGPVDAVPKLTIKLGKPGTESEGKFYTEKNVPKLTIKNIQQSDKEEESKMKLVISQFDDKQQDKVPKITIKNVTKSDTQPLSPKLTIKPIKPPESMSKDEIPKLKITTESISSSADVKENVHIPKITIKPVVKTDGEGTAKTPKKSTVMCDSSDHIPVVTKLNIKPILKPTESGETSCTHVEEKVPVVSKLNIKPVMKPKDNEVDSSIEDVPKITKLNIKPIKNPEESSSDKKDCDDMNADMKDSCIPVVTKLNIKPIVKPVEDEALKDSENQSSETGNSSDENADHIPVVTKLNIKPIIKPETEEPAKPVHNEQCIPVVTKLNIKPIVKPDEQSPASPKKEMLKSPGSAGIPILTKLNIKPIVKPDDLHSKPHEEIIEKSNKPPLLMKITMKSVSESISDNEHLCNNVSGKGHSPKMAHSPKASKRSLEKNMEFSLKPTSVICDEAVKNSESNRDSPSLLQCSSPLRHPSDIKIVPEIIHKAVLNSSTKEHHKTVIADDTVPEHSTKELKTKSDLVDRVDHKTSKKNAMQMCETNDKNARIAEHYNSKASILNCTLLKKLLSSTKEIEITPDTKPSNCISQSEKSEPTLSNRKESKTHEEDHQSELLKRLSPKLEIVNDLKHSSDSVKIRPIEDVHKEANESVTKPLEIITDKIASQSSGQDSPRIILKINKTDQGPSSEIITEDTHKPTDIPIPNDSHESEHVTEAVADTPSPKKQVYSRKKTVAAQLAANMMMGKRLRSSRIVESAEKSPIVKRNVNKRPSSAESPGPLQNKEAELSIYETKKMKLEQLLSANKSLTITPVVSKVTQTSPSKSTIASNQGGKVSHNHSLLNNENSQKNGNSKLQNILSNLQAKQMQTLQLNDTSVTEKSGQLTTEVESGTSTGSSDVIVEITRVENCHLDVQEMIINENSVCDLTGPDEVSQDPLEVGSTKASPEEVKEPAIVTIEMTPTPRKRGRPRKLPLPDNPTPVLLPVPALEERPQRSLRLTRERPAILRKPRGGRGRGRGRGGRRAASPPAPSPEPEPQPEPELEPEPETVVVVVEEKVEERAPSPIDPTSSRIKLPRMTEALDKSVAGASCATPLSSRRRSSPSQTDLKLFSSAAVVLECSVKGDEFMKSPEVARPRSGRGSRGGRGRSPRNRGRGRGGGRGAMYMKETMGIYGRVCGPATTTVQLFEEETCMMDDNATPSKPSHLLDEDSQSSVKSSTNDSNKMKKSKFADLFDSNKVWTAADVKEYTWLPPDTPNAESQVMMIQEQVAMFLGVKSFKRRYPELKRRPVGGRERDYVLDKGLVSEALCDLGITAVDASEVLDIMLSDYPHKYEEYRSYQRQRQAVEETVEVKTEERPIKVEIKSEKTSDKPEPPKVDPEKTRQDMAAAAIASAAEWNARANACRRPASVDLQSNTIHRRRAATAAPAVRCEPPAGFYPHALLPGQYQHAYRAYTPDQLRYFPLSTVLGAPPAPPSPADSSSESEASWGERLSSSEDEATHLSAKRKKLTRKRSSQQDKEDSNAGGEVDTCRVCKLRLEANRKHTHERFLVCANCNAKLHPACVNLPADTIRKCRSYAWQCAECKSCCACRRHQDDEKMLFCDLCDRGFHIYCVGLNSVPSGRWHCVECAICKSCGARDPNGLNPGLGTPGPSTPGPSTPGPSTPGVPTGPGEWHHQTRRGPGGHKVYSHSLCTPCARAYRIGRYCPLCERSFIGPKGTMQLVICKLCDRQLHQECVRQTVSSLRVLDYTCAECRRGGITSRAAAVRAAPRTIATLFMAKRRFNKYAHKQYLASRLQALQDAAELEPEPAPTDEETSRDVDPLEGAGDD